MWLNFWLNNGSAMIFMWEWEEFVYFDPRLPKKPGISGCEKADLGPLN